MKKVILSTNVFYPPGVISLAGATLEVKDEVAEDWKIRGLADEWSAEKAAKAKAEADKRAKDLAAAKEAAAKAQAALDIAAEKVRANG